MNSPNCSFQPDKRADARRFKACGFRIGVAPERLGKAIVARPKPGADFFRIHRVFHNDALVRRGGRTAGKARVRQIERTEKELNARVPLAEQGAMLFERVVGVQKDARGSVRRSAGS